MELMLQHFVNNNINQPEWQRMRSVLRRKNKPDSIARAMRQLKRALADEPDGKVKNAQHIDELRTTINAVHLLIACKTEDELDTAFKMFVDKAQHLSKTTRTTRAAVRKVYMVYAVRKAEMAACERDPAAAAKTA